MENQIKSFEHACEVLGRSTHLPQVSMLAEKHQKAIIAHYKLVTIAEAANFIENGNKEWVPDYSDGTWKYYPWFDVNKDESKPSGVGLSYRYYVSSHSTTCVGSRLCFLTSDLAQYIGVTFIELYEELFL